MGGMGDAILKTSGKPCEQEKKVGDFRRRRRAVPDVQAVEAEDSQRKESRRLAIKAAG